VLERRGHAVQVLDLSGIKNYLDAISAYIDNCSLQALGLTSTTPQLPAVFDIASAIRKQKPDLKLILGGPHVTLTYSAVKLDANFNGPAGAVRAQQLDSLRLCSMCW
jgi:hypothetical protein